MEKKVKEELDKLIIIGNESGMLRTSTVKQLLNDLNTVSYTHLTLPTKA